MRLRAMLLVLLIGLFGLHAGAGAQDKPEERAQRADEAWLALVDAVKYPESWRAASPMFQKAVTEEMWTKAIDGVRGPLGKVESRKLANATYSKTLPGAPDGEYVVAQYRTNFEHKKDAVETVIAVLDKDGSWRLAGYYIK